MGLYLLTRNCKNTINQKSGFFGRRQPGFPVKLILGFTLLFLFTVGIVRPVAGGTFSASIARASTNSQASGQLHETLFAPGPAFNVGEIVYPSGHDFDTSSGTDTCLSLSVPPADTFTLSLEWESLFGNDDDAGDLDLYIYLDSACTESALLTSSFNSNAYTGELAEITPQVRNIGSSPAVAGIRIGKRSGRGIPGQLRLQVLTGAATFLEHGTDGPPLTGQEGAPVFQVTGPFSIPENSPTGSIVGTVTATDPQLDSLTFFELEPAAGQTTFQIDPQTGQVTVEDPAVLDREATDTVVYWVGVTDGTTASLASIGVNLTGVNDNMPVALPTSVITAADTSVDVLLAGTDTDVGPAQQLSMSIVSPPANGSVGVVIPQDSRTASVSYTPSPGFIGTDTFSFISNDGLTTSAPATVTVTVVEDPNAVPTATVVPGLGTPTATAVPGVTPTPIPGSGGTPPFVSSPPPPQPTPVFGTPPPNVSPPSEPRLLRTEARDGSVVITWQRPLSNGGAPIDGYRIFNINTATSTMVLGDVLEGQVRGLENGTSYLFQVRAFNVAGFGEGTLVGPVTPVSANPLLLDVGITVHPDDTITVWWAPPEAPQLVPITAYRLWTEEGELLEEFAPGDPLITTLTDLPGDAYYAFRVTATDEDDEVVAVGLTESVYLPPTLASAYEPMPPDAIQVPLTESARTELQLALQDAAGGEGIVFDAPAILIVRDGEATLFVHVEGLHRALEFSPEFLVTSDQLEVRDSGDETLELQLELEPGVWVSGVVNVLADRSGVLFQLPVPELQLVHAYSNPDEAIREFEIGHQVVGLSPGFTVQIQAPTELPSSVNETLSLPTIRDVAGVLEVTRSGLVVGDASQEQVLITVDETWYSAQVNAGNEISLVRIGDASPISWASLTCEPEADPMTVNCTAELESDVSATAFYALAAVSDTPQLDPTPQPTTLSAPTDLPGATPTPTATPGPSLVVVEELTPVPGPQPTASPRPQPTATPLPPELPESGGGTSVVTWLMSGILGLVVIRGAFYAVGRFRA